jgi:hypothetical protein
MDDVARLSTADRIDLFQASAVKRALNVIVVEKDFWVCWVLRQIFSSPDLPAGLVFKGGTSLSKVWSVIDRFSEDVDLCFDRSDLGFGGDADPGKAASGKKRRRRIDDLIAACTVMIRDQFVPRLSGAISQALGTAPGEAWRLDIDPDDEQAVLFHYPASVARGQGDAAAYLRPFVKLEFGARGEHWPNREKQIQPFVAEDFPHVFKTPTCRVKVVTAERTFWEKATILHSWHHAGLDRPLRDRQSRHYYDMVRLYQSPIGKTAIADVELLRSVSRHKALFFASAWAKYDQAVPGTLRLVPPERRLAELERDYILMRREMIFGEAPTLDDLLEVLGEIERQVNAT